MITDIKNPRWADDEKTRIIVDCKLADGEEVTFVASPTDCTDYGPKIYQDCINGVYGEISDYTPPELSIEQKEAIAQQELNTRLNALMSIENKALAEVDDDFKKNYKSKIKALLDVKKQKGWPGNVVWPDEGE